MTSNNVENLDYKIIEIMYKKKNQRNHVRRKQNREMPSYLMLYTFNLTSLLG